MKIIILGAQGQLGQMVCSVGGLLGHEILAFSKEQLDITDRTKCQEILEKEKPEIVINCAAYHVVPDCEKYPELAFKINTLAQKNLSEITDKTGATIVYISTDKVFDGKTNLAYKESDITNPIQMYGLTKLTGEIVTKNANPRHYIVRTCGIFGGKTGSRAKNGNFVLYLLREAKIKKSLEISMDQSASFVYTEDLAKAIFDLFKVRAEYGVYHIVNEGYDSWANFAKEVVKLNGESMEIIPVDRSGVFGGIKIPQFAGLDISKIQSLGIKIPPWQDGLQKYLNYLRS